MENKKGPKIDPCGTPQVATASLTAYGDRIASFNKVGIKPVKCSGLDPTRDLEMLN